MMLVMLLSQRGADHVRTRNKSMRNFFCTSGDAICAVCTGHLLLMVETPHTCEQNKRNQRKRTPTQPNNNKSELNKPKQAGKTAEFHLCTSKVKHGEKGELRLIATWATN